MALGLENFNRIIDISFIGSSRRYVGSELADVKYSKSIICPRHGIKPEIEINGTYGAALELNAFYITIKNLYLDLRTEQYSRIKVRAGYANNYVDIEADIFNMYQQSPGPDGVTVIECKTGGITKNWIDATVSLNFEKGTLLTKILEEIKKSLDIDEVMTGEKARGLSTDVPIQFDGSARAALTKIEEVFADKNLKTFMQGNKLCAICLTEGDSINRRVLKYMSAPPQQNPGDEDGMWHTMITAPWMPDLQPGDQLEIPLQTYILNRNLVGGAKKTQKLQITQMSFHFGTRGTVNQMTCSGYIVR